MQQQNPKAGNNTVMTPWKLTRQIMATEGTFLLNILCFLDFHKQNA